MPEDSIQAKAWIWLTLTPTSRAAVSFAATARMAIPYRLKRRNSQMASTTIPNAAIR